MVLTFPTQPFQQGNEVVFPMRYSSLSKLTFVDKGQTDKRQAERLLNAIHLHCPNLGIFFVLTVHKLHPWGGISANDPTHVFVLHVFQEAQLSVGSFGKEFRLKWPVQFLNGHFGTTSSING